MTRRPTPWSPAQVVERAAVQAPFDAALAAWRADWAPGLAVRIGGWRLGQADPRASVDGDGWRTPGAGVAFSCGPRARLRLANAALGLDLDAAQPNERDQAVVGGFCDRLLNDLAARFEAVLAAPGAVGAYAEQAPAGRSPAMVIAAIEGTEGVLVRAALPAGPLEALYRRGLPRRPATAALVDRADALCASAVRLEATLGEASLSLQELRAMAPGDVLQLDRKLTDPVRLSLADGGFVAHAALTQSDGRLAVRLQPDLSTGTR